MTGAGQIYSVTFDTPGTYEYDCSIHASQMTGRVVVQ
ncbi:MAG: cupredoxin domain-containing protein [Gemmatimonadales bacterium]